MSQYRIVQIGNSEYYKVQRKVLGIFWITVMGGDDIMGIDDARFTVKICQKADKRKGKNVVVQVFE